MSQISQRFQPIKQFSFSSSLFPRCVSLRYNDGKALQLQSVARLTMPNQYATCVQMCGVQPPCLDMFRHWSWITQLLGVLLCSHCTAKSTHAMCPPNLQRFSRFGCGLLSGNWDMFELHNLPSAESPNHFRSWSWRRELTWSLQIEFLCFSFSHCVCCTICSTSTHLIASPVLTQISPNAHHKAVPRSHSRTNRTDCKKPPKDWRLDEWPS